jgi:hypothetical protein
MPKKLDSDRLSEDSTDSVCEQRRIDGSTKESIHLGWKFMILMVFFEKSTGEPEAWDITME